MSEQPRFMQYLNALWVLEQRNSATNHMEIIARKSGLICFVPTWKSKMHSETETAGWFIAHDKA